MPHTLLSALATPNPFNGAISVVLNIGVVYGLAWLRRYDCAIVFDDLDRASIPPPITLVHDGNGSKLAWYESPGSTLQASFKGNCTLSDEEQIYTPLIVIIIIATV